MRKRIVVIGAGPGGLASAMMMGATDAEVTVIERQGVVGGRSAPIDREGFRFDTGPTFFLYPRILSEIFAACGHNFAREVELRRLDPQYEIRFGTGERVKATGNIPEMAGQIAQFSPHDAANLPKFLADNRTKLEAFRPILERPFNSVADLFAPDVLAALRHLRPNRSVERDLTRFFSDPRTRLIFSFQTKYLGMSPFRCPSLFTILSFLEYEHGVFHPIGGCGAVMEKMASLSAGSGVDIRTGEDVTKLHFDGKRITAVETDRSIYPADAVVINADFARAMQRLVPNHLRRRWTDAKLAKKRYSCSTYMMYLGIEGRVDDMEHHTIFLAEDYVRNIREIEEGRVLTEAPSFYIQNACRTDPGLAPKDCSTLYVLVPVPHHTDHIAWTEETLPDYRRKVLERLAHVGIPDIEKRIRYEQTMTPAGWRDEHQIYNGATFNLAHSLDQMLMLRPKNRFDELEGVYLVGGGTHPGSGLPVIFESAKITTRLLIDDLKLRHSLDWTQSTPATTVAETAFALEGV
jgi:phytoene desaturase